MKYKKIPKTSENFYISGWEALNTPGKTGSADWHPLNFWASCENGLDCIKLYCNPILGKSGIEKREIKYSEGPVFIANHPRALADLIYKAIKENKNIELYQKDSEDLLTDEECREYWKYLRKMAEYYEEIDEFSKIEFTKWYLEECYLWNY